MHAHICTYILYIRTGDKALYVLASGVSLDSLLIAKSRYKYLHSVIMLCELSFLLVAPNCYFFNICFYFRKSYNFGGEHSVHRQDSGS